jgi:hypothetical protein
MKLSFIICHILVLLGAGHHLSALYNSVI